MSMVTAGLTDRMKEVKAIVTARSGTSDLSIPQSSPHINQDYRRLLVPIQPVKFQQAM